MSEAKGQRKISVPGEPDPSLRGGVTIDGMRVKGRPVKEGEHSAVALDESIHLDELGKGRLVILAGGSFQSRL